MRTIGRVLGWVVHWIVFFDGECGLCSRTVRLLARLDRRAVLKFAPIQGETAAEMEIEVPEADGGTIVVVREDGERFERGDAALELAGVLGWPWRLGRVFGLVPRCMRDAAYDFVARRRRWCGDAEGCRLPGERLRDSLLP